MSLDNRSWLAKHSLVILFSVASFFAVSAFGSTNEYRVWYVDSWGAGLFNSNQVSQLVADARAGNFNTLLVQVRRRGDAFYNSNYEPKNASVAADFDPLADLINKAHDTNSGARLEVHAQMTTYAVWNGSTALQTNHPYVLHPEWLSRSSTGETYDGANYHFDPGHPEVQNYLANVALDIVANYDIDGFNFDYVYYKNVDWGYHPVSVARFNKLTGRTGTPGTRDEQWMQFRRDQITSLIRRVYFSAAAFKPAVKISANTWGWWANDTWLTSLSSPYNNSLQDWVTWMNQGILDANFVMQTIQHRWDNDSNFSKDHAFGRHVVPQAFAYYNSLSNVLSWARSTRLNSPTGNPAHGVGIVDYSDWSPEGLSRAQFVEALTTPGTYDHVTPPVFAEPANVPAAPWKQSSAARILGTVTGRNATNFLEGVDVAVDGTTSVQADATGYYQFDNLAPGEHSFVFGFNGYMGYSAYETNVTVEAGQTLILNVTLDVPKYPVIVTPPQNQTVGVGGTATFRVSWTGDAPMTFQWIDGFNVVGTNETLVITNVQETHQGGYRVVLRNDSGLVSSDWARLLVDTNMILPQITAQPAGWTNVAGATLTLSAEAIGTSPLAYQWMKDSVVVPGATNAVLTVTNAQPAHNGDYQVVVSNPYGTATSSVAPVLLRFYLIASTSVPQGGWGIITRTPSSYAYETNAAVSLSVNGGWGAFLAYWTGEISSTDNPLNLTMKTNTVLQAVILAGSPNSLVMENYNATYSGTWQTGTSAAGRLGNDYRFSAVTNGSPTATATYRPNIRVSGKYDIQLYYPQGSNRSTNSQWHISGYAGTTNVGVSQQINGGKWVKIASDIYFARGTEGYVELRNNTGDAGKVVMADAVMFLYSPDQTITPLMKKDGYQVSNGVVNMEFAITPDQPFRVECSTNLIDWTTVTNGVAAESPAHFSSESLGLSDRCFYRVASP